MKQPDMHRDSLSAWQESWRLRCCPPEYLLAGESTAQLHEHLEICPWCRNSQELEALTIPRAQQTPPRISSPRPGQIYVVRSSLTGWGPKRRYYNAPVVLILSLPDARSVYVSQIYGDLSLAGLEDVAFDAGIVGFAEPWNCYTLMVEDLGPLFGEVAETLVATVLERAQGEGPAPEQGSLLWFFRHMEVETGYYFSRQAVSRLMAAHQRQSISLLKNTDTQKLRNDLARLPLKQLKTIPSAADTEDLLARTEADDRSLPLAAAEREGVFALVFTMDNGRLISVSPTQLSISMQEYDDGLLTVTGSTELESGLAPCLWLFRWRVGDDLVAPLAGQFGCEEGVFWAAFPLSPDQAEQPGELVVRVVLENCL